jgi:DHA1 family bicyclomycin/chloramphenicol resistance-like MFS transporter
LSERALILLLSFVVTIGSVATNLYIPALPAVREHFDASVAEVQTTFSVALLTFAVGMLVWGPFADRYGRRAALFGGIALMTAGSVACLVAPNLGWLVLGRAVSAFGTASGLAVSRAIVSDVFPTSMARMLAQLAIVSVVASASAPVVGGVLTSHLGWRSVFGALIVFGVAIGWLVWRHLPETRPAAHAPPDVREMARVGRALLLRPLYLSCVLQSSAAYSMFVVFISLAPYVMVTALGHSATEYGLYYPLISIGYVLGNWALNRFSAHGQPRLIAFGVALQFVAAVAALAFVAAGLRHPLWIFAPMGVLYFGQGLFMPHLTAIAVSQAPPHATGVGSSALGFLNQLISALCVQAMGLLGADSALPMLAFVLGAAVFQWLVLRLSPTMQTAERLS